MHRAGFLRMTAERRLNQVSGLAGRAEKAVVMWPARHSENTRSQATARGVRRAWEFAGAYQRTERYMPLRSCLLSTSCQSWPWRERKKPAQDIR